MTKVKRTKTELTRLRRRFKAIIDWGFGGSQPMAADVLRMPFSTVAHYCSHGPRRISPDVVMRIEELTRLGYWLIGHTPPGREKTLPDPIEEATGWSTYSHKRSEGRVQVPGVVKWRIWRVVEEVALRRAESMGHADSETDINTLLNLTNRVFLAPIRAGLESGVYREREGPNERTVDRARQMHKLCEFWETEFGIGRPTADTVEPVFYDPPFRPFTIAIDPRATVRKPLQT